MSSHDAIILEIINTLRYAGKRLTAKKIGKIIDRIPHTTYVEPMVGMGTVFFKTTPVENEVLNDLDCGIVREMKRNACKNPKNDKCKRLKNAKITCGIDYKKIIKKYDSKNTLIYLDPPYEGIKSNWEQKRYDVDNLPLEEVLKACKTTKGTCLLSYSPKRRKEICSDKKIQCKTIPFKFWGQPRKDLLAIKK